MSTNYDNVFVACDWSDLPSCPMLASLGFHRLPWLDADDDDDEGESRLCSTMVVDEQIVCCDPAVPSSHSGASSASSAPLRTHPSIYSTLSLPDDDDVPLGAHSPLLIFLATQCARSYPLSLSFSITSTLSSVNSAVTVARCDSEPRKPADPTAYTMASGRYRPIFFYLFVSQLRSYHLMYLDDKR